MKREAASQPTRDRAIDLEDQVLDLTDSATGTAARTRSGTIRAYRRVARWLAISDGVAVVAAFGLAYVLRYGSTVRRIELVGIGITALLFVGVFAMWRLYSVYRYSEAEEFRRMVGAISVGMTIVIMGSYWTKASLSRLWIGYAWVLCVLLVFVGRRLWHIVLDRRRANGRLAFRTLVVGAGQRAEHIAEVLESQPVGFDPLGFVVVDGQPPYFDGLPILGDVEDIRWLIHSVGAECLFVAGGTLTEDQMRAIAKVARAERIEVRVSVNLPETHSRRVTPQPTGSVMTLSLQPVELTGSRAALKRTLDIVGSGVGLLILTPVLLCIGVAVKATSRGPVLFRQQRVGRHGKVFPMLKVRTMVHGAEGMRTELEHRNESSGPMFKIKDDPRVTRVGRFLRRWSLDELPQLFNVLKADMSLVGPRPPLPDEVASYEDWQYDRLEVRPGITGLWQVSGRSDLTFEDSVRLDVFYIENWSLSYDLFILAKTVPAVLSRRGSY